MNTNKAPEPVLHGSWAIELIRALRQTRPWKFLTASPKRRLSIAAILVVAGLMSKTLWIPGVQWSVRYSFRAAAELIALLLLVDHIATWSNEKSHVLPEGSLVDWPGNFVEARPDHIRLAEQQASYWSTLSYGQVANFIDRLTQPWQNRIRVIENIELGQSGLARIINLQFQGKSYDAGGIVLLPYARPPKGSVLANLKVTAKDDMQVRTLSYEETTSLLFGALQISYISLFPDGMNSNDGIQFALPIFARIVTSHHVTLDELSSAENELSSLPGLSTTGSQWTVFCKLLRVCGTRRPLIAQVRIAPDRSFLPSEVLELTYSHNQPLSVVSQITKYADQYERRKQRMRRVALLPPSVTLIDVSISRACRTYQARVRPPKNTYICEATLIDKISERPIPNLKHGTAYNEFASWRRGPHMVSSELHTTNFGLTKATRPQYVIRVAEIPPGSIGRAVIASLSVLFAIWVTGVLFSGVAPSTKIAASTAPAASESIVPVAVARNSPQLIRAAASQTTSSNQVDQATDVVAFVLGIPAVLGAWMALSAARAESFVSLAGRMSIVWTATLSVGSATLYLLHAHKLYTVQPIPGGRNILFIKEWGWAIIFLLAVAGAFFSVMTLAIRTYRYRLLPGTGA